jgi:hypothetical protein
MLLPCSPLGSMRSLSHRHACTTPKREERRRMSEVGESEEDRKRENRVLCSAKKGWKE